jgi:hypothetical protein
MAEGLKTRAWHAFKTSSLVLILLPNFSSGIAYNLSMNTSKQSDLLLAIGAFVIAFALWQFNPFSPVVYPLRLFVTFIHELGHGLAAEATGGDFLQFRVESSGAGLAYTRGGYRPAIIAAGYTGTALFGAVLLYAANRGANPRWLAFGLGLGFSLLTLSFLGNAWFLLAGFIAGGVVAGLVNRSGRYDFLWYGGGAGFILSLSLVILFAHRENALSMLVGLLSGAALMALAWLNRREVTLFALNLLACVVGLNAITDAWVLFNIVATSERVPSNDASSMAREVGLSSSFWAISWIAWAVFLFGLALWATFFRRAAASDDSN